LLQDKELSNNSPLRHFQIPTAGIITGGLAIFLKMNKAYCMKKIKVSLAALGITAAAICAFTTDPKHFDISTFAVYGNSTHGSLLIQCDYSSLTLVATQTTPFTNPQLNSLANIHCPAPNDIVCLAEVNLLDGAQDPGTCSAAPIATRNGTFI